MSYRFLLASDMDYTLLLPGMDVSDKNKKAIQALKDNGIALTLATGRTPFLVGRYVDDLAIDMPVIASNGGELYDFSSRSHIFSASIPEATTRQLLNIFFDKRIDFTGYANETVYFSPDSTRRDFFDKYNDGLAEEKKAIVRTFEKNMLSLQELPKFNKFLLVDCEEEIITSLKQDSSLEIVSSASNFYDVMRAGSTKGSALTRLANRYDIPTDHVFAIGDNENDISMISEAGHGIAMGNSNDIVKSKAEFVTTSCEEDGFAKACYDFIIPLAKSLM